MNTPQFIPLPQAPPKDSNDDYISFKKSTGILIIIGIGVLMFLMIIFERSGQNTLDGAKIMCVDNNDNVLIKNNIQASHGYKQQVSQLGTLYCIKADDSGELYGNSMQPTFFEGNTVLTRNFNVSEQIYTGDLIRYFRFDSKYPNCEAIQKAVANNSLGGSYINNSMAVIHRVSAAYDDLIVAEGDNLNELETINKCQITDVVVGIIFT
jgi:hypothetical protein